MINTENFFEKYDFSAIINKNKNSNFNISDYYKILSKDFPDFLQEFINLPLLKRLSGIGLLCGSDWTKLFSNRFFYSRLDHSIGVALIVWNFTHSVQQTLAGLFHDITTSVFSHVSDFRKGDALTQTVTEKGVLQMLQSDRKVVSLLKKYNLTPYDVCDYHIFPIADNEIPFLSADRLEYMFPSGAALEGKWNLAEIKEVYDDLAIFTNEEKKDELGFNTTEIAIKYCKEFCITGHLLQLNEDKLTLHFLGQIMNLAEEKGIVSEKDFMSLDEKSVIQKIVDYSKHNPQTKLSKWFNTFTNMQTVLHLESLEPIKDELENHFVIDLQVKQRFINPLVKGKRLSAVSPEAKRIIDDFKLFADSKFGAVRLI